MSSYLYGFTLADAPHDLDGISGVDHRGIFMITYGDVSALVSNYDSGNLEISGKDIIAHQQVVRELMEQSSIIPLEFGLTLKDLWAVEDVVRANHDHLFQELQRIYRKVEMELSLRFAAGDLLEYLLENYPYLREEMSEVVNGRLIYNYGNRARRNPKFEETLKKEKAILASKVEAIVGPWCAEIARSSYEHKEKEVVTFNCLVNRERLKVFEKSIYDAAERYCGDLLFTFNGPRAPQHFCDLSKISYD